MFRPRAERPVIVGRITIQIAAGNDIEWQTRGICEYVSPNSKPPNTSRANLLFTCFGELNVPFNVSRWALVIIREAPIQAKIEIVLRRRKKEVPAVVDRFRPSVGKANARQVASPLIETSGHAVVVRIARTLSDA